ncbi:MAG: MlaD family protein [Gemmatimonadaceae bacterium]
MPREHEWSELRTGLIAAVAIALLIAATLIFARVGGLHGKKVTLYVATDDASGVLPGTEVWLAGSKAGLVKAVSFRAPSTDTSERLLLTVQLLKGALPNVRKDSYAQIRAGGSVIGTPVIYIAAGTTAFPGLREGDTLRTLDKPSIAEIPSQVTALVPQIRSLWTDVNALNERVSQPTGTLGSFRAHGFPQLPVFQSRASRLAGKAMHGNGTIGLAMRRDLMGRASRAMAATDSIRTLMTLNSGSIGRFRRDTTLMTKAKGVMAELDTVRSLLEDPASAIGKAHSDSTLTREINRSRALLDSLMKDVKKHPLRYISL